MSTKESSRLADSFVLTLRWLVLLAIVVAIAGSGKIGWMTLVPLLVVVLWNSVLALLALSGIYLSSHRQVSVALDVLAALFIFFENGGLGGQVVWVGLLPMLTAGIYYGMRGSLSITILILVGEIALSLDRLQQIANYSMLPALPGNPVISFLVIFAAASLISGLAVGWLGDSVFKTLLKIDEAKLRSQLDNEEKARQTEHDRMRSIYRLLEKLGATLNYQVVLETTIELSTNVLKSDSQLVEQMVGAVLLLDQNGLRVGAARNFVPTDMKHVFPMARGILNMIVGTGEGCQIKEPGNDPELGNLGSMQKCHSALALPLRRGLISYGIMLFAHPNLDFFTPERREVLELITQQAVIAIQNAQQYQDVQKEKERIMDSQDETRKKLARDLHDGPTQSIAGIAMGLSIARMQLERDPEQVGDELARLETLARRTAEEIRHLLFTLRPLVLETEGLAAALLAMGEKMNETYHQNVLVDANPGVGEQFDVTKQTALFYLAEEAVNNARKHARASQINVRLNFLPRDENMALLEISDNGVGFDVALVTQSYERRGSMGLVNLRERAEMVNGILNIDSASGRGTCVSVIIPLNDDAVEKLKRGLVTLPVISN